MIRQPTRSFIFPYTAILRSIDFFPINFFKVLPSEKIRFHVKVIHNKFGGIRLVFRGCSTESKIYISVYIITVGIKKLIFFKLNFLQVSASKKVHFHVKVIHKKIGCILLIFMVFSTETKFFIYVYIITEKKKKN